jgi:hypothetical protein
MTVAPTATVTGSSPSKADSGAEDQWQHCGGDTKGDRTIAGTAEQRKVDFQAGEKHQQQLAEFRHEISDRTIRTEEAKNVRADDDAAEQ